MAAFALDGPCGLPYFSSGQVAALTLAVKGVFQIQTIRFRGKKVAGLALFHRHAFLPEVAALLDVMMALFTSDPGLGVAPVAEQYWRFFPPLRLMDIQPAFSRRLGGSR